MNALVTRCKYLAVSSTAGAFPAADCDRAYAIITVTIDTIIAAAGLFAEILGVEFVISR